MRRPGAATTSDAPGPAALEAAERELSTLWGPVTLTPHRVFASSPRSLVVRATVSGQRAAPSAVVLKVHHGAGAPEAGVRERAALGLLGDLGCSVAPELLGASTSPPLVVLSDLGDRRRVSDALLRGSAGAATEAVLQWADALARVHAATVGVEPVFEAALARDAHRLGAPRPKTDPTSTMLADAALVLGRQLARLGVVAGPAALAELAGLDGLLARDPSARALTPADACPDNNLLTPEGLRLIDFEGAQVRHVAWDAAYLTVPWPSCWCSWRLPDDVADTALSRWRDRCGVAIDPSTFAADLRATTVGWSMASVAWFLARAIDDEPWGDDPALEAVSAPRRTLVAHRLREVVHIDDERLPALTGLAARAALAVESAWGPLELPLAPAWARQST